MVEIFVPQAEPVHDWFGLSYCSYLVLPRSALQSMSAEWQRKFIKLVEEITETLEVSDMPNYRVNAVDSRGKFVADKFLDYELGRRRIPTKIDGRMDHHFYQRLIGYKGE